ncbi:MAG: family 20 glycosylhydrolase [Clostridia bacterium]|nr:family 20 glycosylhydrolase [Clostridia bacterium]
MNIGCLNSKEFGCFPQITTTRIGKRGSLPSEKNELDLPFFWSWQNTLSTGIELQIDFKKEVILSEISFNLQNGSSILSAEVLVNNACIGAKRSDANRPISGHVAIPLSHKAQCWTLRLIPTMTDLAFEMPNFWGAEVMEHTLFPTPTKLAFESGFLSVNKICKAQVDGHEDCAFAKNYFNQSLLERFSVSATQGNGLYILHDDTITADGYALSVDPSHARLRASTRLGLLYGIERLFELMGEDGIPCCHIEDSPYKPLRGIHMYLPRRSEIDFVKRLWRCVLIPFHYNTIFLEIAGGMRYESHPEISEGWLRGNRLAKEGKIPPFPHGAVSEGELLEKDEVRDLCDYARQLGFELIPEVQSLGHVQYITYTHPEIAEIDPTIEETIDARDADVPASKFYHHSYCPQNPKSYEIIFDLMDEIIEVTRPRRFVHMGHDEVYQLGLCPKCKDIPNDQLFEKDIRILHAHLKEKGLRMMIWSDMLQPVSKYLSWPAAERLPRDIVMLDFIWYFHLDKNIEENLLKHGYEVAIGNLYSSHFPRYEERMPALIGGEVSFWCRSNEKSVATEGKFYDLMYTAEMLWSRSYRHEARRIYADRIAQHLPRIRDNLHQMGHITRSFAPLSIPKAETLLPTLFKQTCINAGYSPVRTSDLSAVPVNITADALRFTHTTLFREKRVAWTPLVEIGQYTVKYEDGTMLNIPITYDGNIRCYQYRFGEPLAEKYYRHEGYVAAWEADPVFVGSTETGEPITLLAYEWKNPHPAKKIVEILCTEHSNSCADIVLCAIDTVQYQ